MPELPLNSFDPCKSGSSSSPGPASSGMQYVDAYSYVFNNPNWVMNVALGSVCQLIPIAGPMVFTGYQFEIIEALQRDPRGGYPDFSLEHLAEYLKRGVWPFLVILIINAIVSVPVAIASLVLGALAQMAGQYGASLVPVGMGFFGMPVMAAMVAIGFVAVPLWLRAGLMRNFAEAFRWDFARNFIRTVWKEMLVAAAFMFGTSLVLSMLGSMLCCVGIYPAITITTLATTHLNYQLFQAYLSRGGTPILASCVVQTKS